MEEQLADQHASKELHWHFAHVCNFQREATRESRVNTSGRLDYDPPPTEG
jgi:hypothetical protein